MHDSGREIEIGRNIRTIEWLKTELISGVAQVYKQLPKGRDDLLASALANVVMHCYLLGRRLGISYSKLEAAVERKAKLNAEEGHAIEEWYQDLSTLLEHFEARRN
ncbi:MAG: MazG-like family protein [Bacillota bacterium]|nr:MazG-like family protein [Bacillota bacterium]